MRNWSKGQALLVALIGACVLVTLVSSEAKTARSQRAPISISTISYDCALLAVPFRGRESLGEPKPNKNGASGNRVPTKQVITSSSIYGYSILNSRTFFDGTGNLNSTFGRAFQQACLLLDVPPPSRTVS